MDGLYLRSNRHLNSFLLISMLFIGTGCVSVHDNSAALPDKIAPGQGMMALVIDSSTSFQRLKFKRPGDIFETVAAMDVESGRSIRFITLPPGTYYWARMEFPTNFNYAHYVDFSNGEKNLTFTIKAGTISYPGDLRIKDEGDGYQVRLVDHAAMLLSDLNEQQNDLIKKYGILYTGKGTDRFYQFYYSLSSPSIVRKGH